MTATATEKLEEALQGLTEDPELATRIIATPNRLEMVLDKEGEGDQVVKSEEGMKVLLIESNLAHELEGMVLDYKKTSQGEGFKIYKTSPIEAYQRGEQKWWN